MPRSSPVRRPRRIRARHRGAIRPVAFAVLTLAALVGGVATAAPAAACSMIVEGSLSFRGTVLHHAADTADIRLDGDLSLRYLSEDLTDRVAREPGSTISIRYPDGDGDLLVDGEAVQVAAHGPLFGGLPSESRWPIVVSGFRSTTRAEITSGPCGEGSRYVSGAGTTRADGSSLEPLLPQVARNLSVLGPFPFSVPIAVLLLVVTSAVTSAWRYRRNRQAQQQAAVDPSAVRLPGIDR